MDESLALTKPPNKRSYLKTVMSCIIGTTEQCIVGTAVDSQAVKDCSLVRIQAPVCFSPDVCRLCCSCTLPNGFAESKGFFGDLFLLVFFLLIILLLSLFSSPCLTQRGTVAGVCDRI